MEELNHVIANEIEDKTEEEFQLVWDESEPWLEGSLRQLAALDSPDFIEVATWFCLLDRLTNLLRKFQENAGILSSWLLCYLSTKITNWIANRFPEEWAGDLRELHQEFTNQGNSQIVVMLKILGAGGVRLISSLFMFLQNLAVEEKLAFAAP